MDQTPPNEPRHLNPVTAMMPAIPTEPKHARPDTAELRRQRPPVPPTTRQERREAAEANKVKLPWWKTLWEAMK